VIDLATNLHIGLFTDNQRAILDAARREMGGAYPRGSQRDEKS